jgi:predicted transcriptional regulator
MERQLVTYLQRVEAIFGDEWKRHPEGARLRKEGDLFLKKLSPQAIFDHWIKVCVL